MYNQLPSECTFPVGEQQNSAVHLAVHPVWVSWGRLVSSVHRQLHSHYVDSEARSTCHTTASRSTSDTASLVHVVIPRWARGHKPLISSAYFLLGPSRNSRPLFRSSASCWTASAQRQLEKYDISDNFWILVVTAEYWEA